MNKVGTCGEELNLAVRDLNTAYLQHWLLCTDGKILSRDRVTVDEICIGNWIYWTFTERNYK
jgi:hypothetical protein